MRARPVGIKKERKLFFLLLLVSFFGKFTLRFFLSRNLDYWATGYSQYYEQAKNFLLTGGLFQARSYGPGLKMIFYALRPPLYPLFVALVGGLTHFSSLSFIAAEALISTLNVFVVYFLTRKVAGPLAAIFAAALYAFYPYSFFHDTQLQESVLYHFFSLVSAAALLLSLESLKKPFFFLAGIFLGLAALVRASHVWHSVFLAVLTLLLLLTKLKIKGRSRSFGPTDRRAAGNVACLSVLLTSFLVLGWIMSVSPWLVRNKRVTGQFAMTSHTGIGLAFAHNEFSFHSFPWRSMDESSAEFIGRLGKDQKEALQKLAGDEMARSRWFRSLALNYIRSHKLQTLKRGIVKAAFPFLGILSPLRGPWENALYFLSYWVLTLLAVFSLPQTVRSLYFQIFVTLCLSHALASFIYWSHTSHRSFLDPLLAVLAGIGASRLFRRVGNRAVV